MMNIMPNLLTELLTFVCSHTSKIALPIFEKFKFCAQKVCAVWQNNDRLGDLKGNLNPLKTLFAYFLSFYKKYRTLVMGLNVFIMTTAEPSKS